MDNFFVLQRDPIHKNVQNNQFFYPKTILTDEDQFDKILTIVFYSWMYPFLWWMFWFNEQSNYWAFCLGVLANLFAPPEDADMWAHYPTMYLNFIAEMYLKEQDYEAGVLGPYKYYDMFSLNGYWQFICDCLLNLIPFYYVGYWQARSAIGDYREMQMWPIFDSVDHNRLNLGSGADPWDYAYWSVQPFGFDCNGNMGEGLYCFCES